MVTNIAEGSRIALAEGEPIRFSVEESAARLSERLGTEKGEAEFVRLWTESRAAIQAFCWRSLGDHAAAEDVAQVIGLRAWRSFGSFRREAPFVGWAMRIARNEINRELRRRVMRIAREVPAVDGYEGVQCSREERQGDHNVDLRALILEAREIGAISEPEASSLLLRLANPEKNWTEVAADSNDSAAQCAANHCRAIPKLRVFIFLRHRDLFGDLSRIRESMAEARIAGAMTAREEQVFSRWILDRRFDFRPVGWQTLLRSACATMAARITASGDLGTGGAWSSTAAHDEGEAAANPYLPQGAPEKISKNFCHGMDRRRS